MLASANSKNSGTPRKDPLRSLNSNTDRTAIPPISNRKSTLEAVSLLAKNNEYASSKAALATNDCKYIAFNSNKKGFHKE